MLKKKSIDYLFGMITGMAIMITFWACAEPLGADGSMSLSGGTYELEVTVIGSQDTFYALNTNTGQLYYKNDEGGEWGIVGTPID